MKIAINKEGKRIIADEAKNTEEYICPVCENKVILRKGSINDAHFAHQSKECIDNWHYDMSEWHYSMQERFPKEQREIVVKNKDKKHRADILFENKVIEFQYSPISIEEIEERNNFYNEAGYNVTWVFNVQEQYDSEAIMIQDSDDSIMYKWKNPKRCLQCFPEIKEYNKKLVVYLYWINEDGYENFNRVIWTIYDDYPNFKRFIVSEDSIDGSDVESLLSVPEFFVTKKDRIKEILSKLNCYYKIKYLGVKGHRREDYICPKTNIFGLKIWGKIGCKYCRYCATIEKIGKKGNKIYCCYPKQVNEIENYGEYECSDVPMF